MPYDFQPRDLDDPRGERDPEPATDAMREAFEGWLEASEAVVTPEIGGSTSEKLYRLAREQLSGIDVRAADATTVLLPHAGSVPADAGLFLSAAYNLADEEVVVFDVETAAPVERLGYRLDAAKTLVIDADVGSTMAVESRGLVVNRARVGSYFGYSAHGAFVNAPGGSCQTAGAGAARLFVDLGEVRARDGDPPRVAVGGDGGTVLTAADCEALPELDAFLDRLRDGLGGDPDSVREFLAGLGPSPGRALAAEVDRLLEAGGIDP